MRVIGALITTISLLCDATGYVYSLFSRLESEENVSVSHFGWRTCVSHVRATEHDGCFKECIRMNLCCNIPTLHGNIFDQIMTRVLTVTAARLVPKELLGLSGHQR